MTKAKATKPGRKAKLTVEQLQWARARYNVAESLRSIAKQLGVDKNTLKDALSIVDSGTPEMVARRKTVARVLGTEEDDQRLGTSLGMLLIAREINEHEAAAIHQAAQCVHSYRIITDNKGSRDSAEVLGRLAMGSVGGDGSMRAEPGTPAWERLIERAKATEKAYKALYTRIQPHWALFDDLFVRESITFHMTDNGTLGARGFTKKQLRALVEALVG